MFSVLSAVAACCLTDCSCDGWQVDKADKRVVTSRLMAQEAIIMNRCAHPNVLPVAVVGLQPPSQPCTLADPTRVVYIAFPWADLSLEKRLGSAPLPPPLSFSCSVNMLVLISSLTYLLFAVVCMLFLINTFVFVV